MTRRHTPGPWRHDRDNARIVSATTFYDYSEDDDPQPVSVVSLFGAMGGEDTAADARLIAAAPELLGALEELARLMDDVLAGEYQPDSFTTQPAMRAIAEALGEDR